VNDLVLPAAAPGGADPGAVLVDLRPFLNPSPVAVQEECSVSRVYTLFRSLGLRHLAVTDRSNRVRGVITRKELMSTFEKDLF
jgi:chloride channel 7